MHRLARLALAMGMAAAVASAAAEDPSMQWQRRSLRQAAPEGYLAIVSVARAKAGPARGILACRSEELELQVVEPNRWAVLAGGREVAQGTLDGAEPASFFVKRTPAALVVGANGRWLYSRAASPSSAPPEVAVGVSPALDVKSFRLVSRETVKFADDFPDPVPRTGTWQPVRGQWALSSVTYATQSANPAELAAIFDRLEDVASRGRTREYSVGIGVQLQEARAGVAIALVANDSPAERAGLREGDTIREVDGTRVRSVADANALFQGEVGKTLTVVADRDGKSRTVPVARGVVVWGKSKRQVPLLPFCQDQVAQIVTGYDFWTDYRFTVAVRTQEVGAAGLIFAYLGPGDYHAFRWLGAEKAANRLGEWRIERVRGGRRETLASREGGFHPYDFFALGVEVEGDELGKVKATCFVDGEAVLAAFDDALVPGRLGLWAEAPGVVCFDDVVVGEGGEAGRRAARGTKASTQLTDPTMRYWADPQYQWAYSGIQYWHKAPFPGDVSVSAPVPSAQALGLTVSAEARGAETGYTLSIPEGAASVSLARAGKVVAEKRLEKGAAKAASLAREGSKLRVAIDGKPMLEFTDPAPIQGSLVGAAGVLGADVKVESPCVAEDYFNGCPTDWHVIRGQWEVMNRWVCNPTWSFFGGRSDDDLLAVWSKRRLDGACAIDLDVGVMMMALNMGYENMRDIGVSLCAENQDLASGYAVLVGAYQNQRTMLYRHGKIVASTTNPRGLLPSTRAYARDELHSQHRGWMHIRLEKQGKMVRFYLWDNLALTYEDPEPLPGGHAAVWSVDNGLMLGKVRLAASQLGAPKPVLRGYPTFADHLLTNDCLGGSVGIQAQGSTYEVTNGSSGGPFAVAFRPRVFSAAETPTLSFDIRLSPEAKVDFYFSSGRTLYRVPLGLPAGAIVQCETLPAPEGVKADSEWHRVTIDFQSILRKRNPSDHRLMVWEPMLANFSNQGYLLAGFGGNGAGARYWLRNVAFAAPKTVAAASPSN